MLVGSCPTGRTRGQLPARRLLCGSQAVDMPMEQAKKFELVINLRRLSRSV